MVATEGLVFRWSGSGKSFGFLGFLARSSEFEGELCLQWFFGFPFAFWREFVVSEPLGSSFPSPSSRFGSFCPRRLLDFLVVFVTLVFLE